MLRRGGVRIALPWWSAREGLPRTGGSMVSAAENRHPSTFFGRYNLNKVP
jgi:hypothetical protein